MIDIFKHLYLQKPIEKPILIHNWEELAQLKPSSTHKIYVNSDLGGAWIEPIINSDDCGTYLSTHTFYNKNNTKHKTKKLKECGFNVELIPWEDD